MSETSPVQVSEFVVIESGTVTESNQLKTIGSLVYLVTVHFDNGLLLRNYIGTSYEEAVEEARGWDFPIIDLSQGRGEAS